MMKRASIGLTLTLACAGLSACADTGDYDGGQTLRAAGEVIEFWNFRPNDPGNGDVNLLEDMDDDSLPDTITWTNVGDGVSTDVFDGAGTLVVSTFENQIYDADGNLQCTAYLENGLYKLREGLDGPVILTATQGRYVFWDDVGQLPSPGTSAWQQLIYTQLAYEFYGDVLYDGPRWISDIIAYADVHIHKASPMRKLLIAALYEGECGAGGDPNLPPPG